MHQLPRLLELLALQPLFQAFPKMLCTCGDRWHRIKRSAKLHSSTPSQSQRQGKFKDGNSLQSLALDQSCRQIAQLSLVLVFVSSIIFSHIKEKKGGQRRLNTKEKETVTLVIVKFQEQIGVHLVVFGLDGIIKEAFTPAMTVQFCKAFLILCLRKRLHIRVWIVIYLCNLW